MWRAAVARSLITMRTPAVHFATHNLGSCWDSQGLHGSNPPTEMCEDVTLSATVASHHCAVHVRISLANVVGQTAGVGGLLGRTRPAASTEHLWESHCKWIHLAYWWASLAVNCHSALQYCVWTALWRASVTSHWGSGMPCVARFVLGIVKASTFTGTRVAAGACDQHRVFWTCVRRTRVASKEEAVKR